MNRKLFNGLLLLSVVTGGVGTFTSCTDDLQEFQNVNLATQKDLSAQIDAIRKLTDPEFKTNLDNEIQRLIDAGDFATATDLSKLEAAIDAANKRIDALDEAYKKADEELRKNLTEKITTEINLLKKDINEFKESVTKDLAGIKDRLYEAEKTLKTVESTANDALEQAQNNAEKIKTLNDNLEKLSGTVDDLQGDLKSLQDEVKTVKEQYDELLKQLNEYQDNTDIALDQLREQINEFNLLMNDMYKSLMNKFANLVTGIEVEQVRNGIFGTLNLPIGIESNIIGNYYAVSDHNVVFPPRTSTYEYWSSNPALKDLNLDLIGAPAETVLATDEPVLGKMGDVYLTVNPAERNFAGLRLSIVNSRDEQVLGQLKLEKSSELLKWGGTRSSENNGFYYAAAVSEDAAADIAKVKVPVEDGLLSSFKAAIKDHTKADFIELAKVLYKQMTVDIPAYAVKCEWDDTELDATGTEVPVTKSVRSGYNLAVGTFNPLSYRTAWGFGTDHELPTIGNLQSIVDRVFAKLKNSLQLGLTGVEVKDIKIDLTKVQISVNVDNIVIDLSGLPIEVDGEPGVIGEGTKIVLTVDANDDGGIVNNPNAGALKPLADSIKQAIEKMLKDQTSTGLSKQIEEQLKTQLDSIVQQVNDQILGVQNKIDNTVDNIKDKIDAELNGKFGYAAERLVDLYNRLAQQLNRILKNPNAYLQVMMAYMGNDNELHHVSTAFADATPMKAGSGAMELFATSYNAEILVPAYKKYVAVVDAVKDGQHDINVAKAANVGYLNKVLPGNQQRVYLDGSALKAGYTYTIVYSSLDYRGYTSTKLYYVKAY